MSSKKCPDWILDFGDVLRREFSKEYPGRHGDCYVFAEALKEYLGKKASLWAVSIVLEGGGEWIVHVAVKVGNCFLDADGAWTREAMLKDWYPQPDQTLKPFNQELRHGIRCPRREVEAYYNRLVKFFGEG